ncbi:hypothetical protein FB451DRAFT_1554521 [Mycena latifolia]|nr:hypothetical protein FB451DRAFT_1554521 [Mycena latifolia]
MAPERESEDTLSLSPHTFPPPSWSNEIQNPHSTFIVRVTWSQFPAFGRPAQAFRAVHRHSRPSGGLARSAGAELATNGDRPVDGGLPATGDFAGNTDILAPILYPEQKYTWITENQKTTYALFRCMKEGNCAQNQTKVVIISSVNFRIPLQGGYIGGEAIWALSTACRAKSNLFGPSLSRTLVPSLYHIFANLVKMVIANPDQVRGCFNSVTCLRSTENPAGIPAWKIFSFVWWAAAKNPMERKWTLNPEDYHINGQAINTYLGYSIEAQCSKYPFIPHSQRKSQVYVLAKFLNDTGASFVVAAKDQDGSAKLSPGDLAASITNVGPVTQDQFYDLLSKSPTPYDAMCLGVPFINPISAWDKDNITDTTKWTTQHNMLKSLSPPYVYHVFKGDRVGFVNAIKDAIANPIASYIPERMRMTAVEERFGRILEHDWKAEAEATELLKAREAGEAEGPLFVL